MSLFWMTAPVAWLYAIPVERFMEPVAAAKANLALLMIVSLWRVWLMSRVIQVLTQTSFIAALSWVLFAAAVEVLVVIFFGGAFAKSIMASMGGMRNSPAEEVVLRRMSNAFSGALITVPAAFVLALITVRRCSAEPFPPSVKGPTPWAALGGLAVLWIAVSILAQCELRRNFTAENFLRDDKPRAFLDFLAAHQPEQFAAAKVLPPNPYEREIFLQLPSCLAAVRASDPAWLRQHLVRRSDEMVMQLRHRWITGNSDREHQLRSLQHGMAIQHIEPVQWNQMLDGLERIPKGSEWFSRNPIFLEALKTRGNGRFENSQEDSDELRQWSALSNRIEALPMSAPIKY